MTELIPTKWKSSVEGLRDNINNVFERYLGKFKRQDADHEPLWSPMVFEFTGNGIELEENNDEIIGRLALPGLSKSDVKVEVTRDRLVIRGNKKQSRKNKNRGYTRHEESEAAFAQAVSLPCEIDRDRVKARYKNGLLTVTMPKGAKRKRIKIPVNA